MPSLNHKNSFNCCSFSYVDLVTLNPIPSSSLPPSNGAKIKQQETVTSPLPTTKTLTFYSSPHCRIIGCVSLYDVDITPALTSHCSSSAFMYEGKPSDLGKSSGKQIGEAGASSSSQAEEEDKGGNTIFRQKETANQPAAEIFSHGGSAIRPGMFASDVKFGGCGSYPELPWVSTTAPGPNGKTISGVTYKYNRNQIKIVCACHGSHMTPEEFVQHASAEASNQENNTSLASLPASNPAASAQN